MIKIPTIIKIVVLCSLIFSSTFECFVTNTQKFIHAIYEKHPALPEECGHHIEKVLKKFENEDSSIIVDSKIRSTLLWIAMRNMDRSPMGSSKFSAFEVMHYMISDLHKEEKRKTLRCIYCKKTIYDANTQNNASPQITLSCAHVFCKKCIVSWFSHNLIAGINTCFSECPTCNTPLVAHVKNKLQQDPTYKQAEKDVAKIFKKCTSTQEAFELKLFKYPFNYELYSSNIDADNLIDGDDSYYADNTSSDNSDSESNRQKSIDYP